MNVFPRLKAARKTCLECAGDNVKYLIYCPNDGVHSTRCHIWPYRFGCRPQTIADQKFVTPGALPGPEVNLDDLPMVKVARRRSGRKLTPEERQRHVDQLRRGREKQAAGVS